MDHHGRPYSCVALGKSPDYRLRVIDDWSRKRKPGNGGGGAARKLAPVLIAGLTTFLSSSARAQGPVSPTDPRPAGSGEPAAAPAAPAAPETETSAPASVSAADAARPAEPEPPPATPSAPASAPKPKARPRAGSDAARPTSRRTEPATPCPCAAEAKAPAPASAEAEHPEPGYGWTIVLADLFNVGTHVLLDVWGVADPDKYKKRWPVTLGSVYVLTGPVVHLTKEHPDRAWKSLGFRLGMPLAIGGLGALGGELTALGGVAFGMAAAVILDAAILGSSEGTQVPESDDGWIQTAGPWLDLEGRAVGASLACAL